MVRQAGSAHRAQKDNGGVGPLRADWTPTDIHTYDDAKVQVYSNAEEVELFLNDEIGRAHV